MVQSRRVRRSSAVPSLAALGALAFAGLALHGRLATTDFLLPGERAEAPKGPSLGRRAGLLGAGLLGAAVLQPPSSVLALTSEELHAAALFLKAAPGVIGITDASLTKQVSSRAADRAAEHPAVTGSGFVWDGSHIVTNYHVVDDMKSPQVVFITKDASGEDKHSSFAATIVGADPLSDIAVLEVSGDSLILAGLMVPLGRGVSETLLPGQAVFALGNPFGLEHSMSRGVISGLSRTMQSGVPGRPIRGVIQTDASINPGNSGGPLLDSDGNVIGLNSAILSSTGTFSGIGLAIPIDTVKRNVGSMISNGFVSRSSLGVVLAPEYLTEVLGVKNGAMVMKVFPGSPAQQAGVQAMRRGHIGDVIVGMAGKPVTSTADVFNILETSAPGDDLPLQIRRVSADADNDEFEVVSVTVRLGASNSKLVMT